eukprot:593922-Pelagomonas_calceolata.AAC.2
MVYTNILCANYCPPHILILSNQLSSRCHVLLLGEMGGHFVKLQVNVWVPDRTDGESKQEQIGTFVVWIWAWKKGSAYCIY